MESLSCVQRTEKRFCPKTVHRNPFVVVVVYEDLTHADECL